MLLTIKNFTQGMEQKTTRMMFLLKMPNHLISF